MGKAQDVDEEERQQQTAERIGDQAQQRGFGVAAAESLTGGLISTRLAAAPKASEWYRGGVVAYDSAVKYDVLGVPEGPVVSAAAAGAMAAGVATLMHADVAVAVTGVGGPDAQDDQPPGTVFIGVHRQGDTQVHECHLDGDDPTEICQQVCTIALDLLAEELTPGDGER